MLREILSLYDPFCLSVPPLSPVQNGLSTFDRKPQGMRKVTCRSSSNTEMWAEAVTTPYGHPNLTSVAISLATMLLRLFLLALSPTVATANHFTCDWGGPGEDPAGAGWLYYCTGEIENETSTTADYICHWPSRTQSKVADSGQIGAGKIEMATPCNGHGFAPFSYCYCNFWNGCLGEQNTTTHRHDKCRFLYKSDDCEWPDVSDSKHKPAKVTIFHTPYAGPPEIEKSTREPFVSGGGKSAAEGCVDGACRARSETGSAP